MIQTDRDVRPAGPHPFSRAQEQVDAMLGDPVFAERFARFTNGELNPQPGVSVAQDASYTLARYVLTNKKPWSELVRD